MRCKAFAHPPWATGDAGLDLMICQINFLILDSDQSYIGLR